MRARLPWILFFVSLALNVSVIAGVLWVGHGKLFGGEPPVARLARELNLNDDQRQALEALRQEVIARRAEVEESAGRGIDTTIAALSQPTYDPDAVRWASIERSQPMRDFFIWVTGRLHAFAWSLDESQRALLIRKLDQEPGIFWVMLRPDPDRR